MHVPLLDGRLFEPPDSIGEVGYAPQVICNQTLAQRHWPGESAVGKKCCVVEADYEKMEIVGDARFSGLASESWPELYYPEALFPQSEFTLLVRTEVPPEQMMGVVEKLVRDAEPDVVITDTASMDTVLSKSLSKERFWCCCFRRFHSERFCCRSPATTESSRTRFLKDGRKSESAWLLARPCPRSYG